MKLLSLLFILISCQKFVKNTDSSYSDLMSNYKNASEFHIIFSNNISGETHPCGCRHFPLGGLPQVAGQMHEIKSKYPSIYVDTGDTLFPNSNLPSTMEKSLTFAGENLNRGLTQLGLSLFTLGDQDLAKGLDFLGELQKKSGYTFLVSNFAESVKLKHKKWVKVPVGPMEVYFIGVIDPFTVLSRDKDLFTSPLKAVGKAIEEINKLKGKNSRIILMSHSGMERDKALAKKYKDIDWIIGSHTQSFTRIPVEEGNAKIVQVLSRNHYIGDIALNLSDKKKDSYKIHEMRTEQSKKLPNNPFHKFIQEHKTKLQEIQLKEQDALAISSDPKEKVKPASSCLECHSDQHKFWQGTAHSISYYTLYQAKEQNNPECIKCHSVNFMKDSGFYKTQNVVILADEKKKEKYWKEFSSIFKGVESVRELKQSKIRSLAQKSDQLDSKFKVKHNFANVQCLNCHEISNQHPFEISDKPTKKDWVTTCTQCHTTDQSPEWYTKDDKGLARELNKAKFQKMLKSMTCPKHKD